MVGRIERDIVNHLSPDTFKDEYGKSAQIYIDNVKEEI